MFSFSLFLLFCSSICYVFIQSTNVLLARIVSNRLLFTRNKRNSIATNKQICYFLCAQAPFEAKTLNKLFARSECQSKCADENKRAKRPTAAMNECANTQVSLDSVLPYLATIEIELLKQRQSILIDHNKRGRIIN